jgi:hypothetical protein
MNIEKALAIDGWMSETELSWLANQAMFAQTIIEVGSWKGRSTRALADNTSGIIYAVDHFRGSPELVTDFIVDAPDWLLREFHTNLSDHIPDRIKIIPLDSGAGAVHLLRKEVRADLIFLDGSHFYLDLIQELARYRLLAASGCIMCGHDFSTAFPGVMAAVYDGFLNLQVQLVPDTTIWWVKL